MPSLLTVGGRRLVLGVVHLPPLPGTPFHRPGSLGRTLDSAVGSALALRDGGADGCLLQTVDRVYPVTDTADPARVAAMTLVAGAVRAAVGTGFAVGVQLMRNAVRASLAVATVTGGDFVRATAIVGATMSTHGLVQSDPVGVMDYRRSIDAWDVGIVADIESMHYQWFGGGKPTGEVARAAALVGADAVCVGHPDERRALAQLAAVRAAAPALPVLLAGYTDHGNAARLLAAADGAFVGGCLTRGGSIDAGLVRRYVDAVRSVEP